ncbi:hypothetical protein MNEG_10665, partial [Monoraphidium neglectum]
GHVCCYPYLPDWIAITKVSSDPVAVAAAVLEALGVAPALAARVAGDVPRDGACDADHADGTARVVRAAVERGELEPGVLEGMRVWLGGR